MLAKDLRSLPRNTDGRINLGYVPENVAKKNELKGARKKFWFQFPDTNVLFKQINEDTYEDYAELLSEAMCEAIGLPSAHYDLASYNGNNGVISYDFRKGKTFISGSVLLKRYVNTIEENNGLVASSSIPGNKYNNLNTIYDALLMECSENTAKNIIEKLDLLYGLDCLCLQADRHWNNWGIQSYLQRNGILKREFAPQFDGSCMCRFTINKSNIKKKIRYLNKQSSLNQIQKIYETEVIPGGYDITSTLRYHLEKDSDCFGISRLMIAYEDDPLRFRSVLDKLCSIDPVEIVCKVEERIGAPIPEDCSFWFMSVIDNNKRIIGTMKSQIDSQKGIPTNEEKTLIEMKGKSI